MATETVGPTVVIDLGLDRGEPETYLSPTRSTVPDWFRPLMLGLLVLLITGPADAPPPPVLTELLSVRVGPADSYTISESGRLLAQTLGTLASYDLGNGKQDWQTGIQAPTYRLRSGSGVALLRPWGVGPGEPVTTAIDVRSGLPRWQHPGSVTTIPGSPALLAVTGVRTVSTSGRRIQGPVESLDPATGATLWQVPVSSTAVLIGVPGPAGAPPRMLLVHDNRTMAVHDLTTGKPLVRVSVPPADYGPDNPAVSGGLILLRHPTGWGAEISAYDPVTLALRWQRPAGGAFEAEACGRLACLAGPDGVEAVNPANGAIEWYQPSWRGVEMRGNLLLAYSSPSGSADPVGLADPETGRILTDLRGWRPMTATVNPGAENEVLLTRVVDAGARSIVAVAGPRDAVPQLISDLPPGTGDCQSVPERLICRSTSGELIVWAYHKRG